MKTVHVIISGKVQGVCYRAWTVETATALGLNGWVRNRRDETVEAVFSGGDSAVDAMLADCKEGPPAARVRDVKITSTTDIPETGFRQLPTV